MEELKMSAILTAPEAETALAADLLPDHPLFAGLSEAHRQILAECSVRASFIAGETVVETGDPADCLYLVISGSLALETPGGRASLRIRIIGAGDILGWSWLFPPDCWHFDAVAEEPTELIYFRGSRLRQACDRDQKLAYELFKRLAQRSSVGKSVPATGDQSISSSYSSTSFRDSSLTWWPQVVIDTARAVVRFMSGTGKPLIPGEPCALLSPSPATPSSASKSKS
jgi:CRP/FNR family transcriptional regulator, cyclic AMP receptor protein